MIGMVEHISAFGFAETIDRLLKAITGAGMTLFARIDHAAGAHAAGMQMPPTEVLIYGSPKGGTPIMLAAPRAALDLPLRVLVREDTSGRTLIGFHPVGGVLRDAGVADDLATRLDAAQRLLIDAITQ
jgi:uncharacterized protein (DUF302 family)